MTSQVNQIVDLSRGPIRGVKPLATLREAAIELSEEQVGALIVRDRRGVLGILTEFDISRALAEGADPDDDRVRSFMTDRLVTIPGGASLREAADSMARHEIRHLLIVDGDGEPVGVVSARDLLTILGQPTALSS